MSRSLRLNPAIVVEALDDGEVTKIPCGTRVLARTSAGMWCRAVLIRHRAERGWHQMYVTHEWIRGGWIKLDRAREQTARSEEIVAYHYSPTATSIYEFLDASYLRGQE